MLGSVYPYAHIPPTHWILKVGNIPREQDWLVTPLFMRVAGNSPLRERVASNFPWREKVAGYRRSLEKKRAVKMSIRRNGVAWSALWEWDCKEMVSLRARCAQKCFSRMHKEWNEKLKNMLEKPLPAERGGLPPQPEPVHGKPRVHTYHHKTRG